MKRLARAAAPLSTAQRRRPCRHAATPSRTISSIPGDTSDSRLPGAVIRSGRGISLEEICEEYGFSHSTAQRMTEALVATFPLADHNDGEDRKRRWTLADPDLDKLVVQ